MIDIKLIRENKELVKENIKKKFQDEKLPLVDEVFEMDQKAREAQFSADNLKAEKNKLSKEIGPLMAQSDKDSISFINELIIKLENSENRLKGEMYDFIKENWTKDELKDYVDDINEIDEIKLKLLNIKIKISNINSQILVSEHLKEKLDEDIKAKMMVIPNIIDASVPIGKDDSENVEVERFGEAKVPSYEIPYHADIIDTFNGLDKESAGRTSGEGFYYLLGDIARLHEAMIACARDFMIDHGFTYAIPPFMIRSDVVNGVMSFSEMESMMYKIEGEDLYLIGTSEHSMIGRFKGQMLKKDTLPINLTSYSPCFRKEGGSHGLEERGLYRVHQFEKQEMIVICEPNESMDWYNKMWKLTVDLFRSWDIPVRQLECCSGDLADLKVKSCDIEAWSPRQQKYFEVGSCSTLGDAQARRLGIRIKGENGNYYPHTLNNTVVATPRGLIALLENNYQEDGSVKIPKVLQPYMGGKEVLIPIKK